MHKSTRIIKYNNVNKLRLSLLSTTKNIVRNDWTKKEIQDIYDLPFMELVHKAAAVHR